LTDLGLNKGRGTSDFWLKENLFFPVNAKKDADSLCNPIIFVPVLPASLTNLSISDVGFFKGNLRSQTFFEVPPDCYCK
jgi:hypothetical protein